MGQYPRPHRGYRPPELKLVLDWTALLGKQGPRPLSAARGRFRLPYGPSTTVRGNAGPGAGTRSLSNGISAST
jgi:hypothetical protein